MNNFYVYSNANWRIGPTGTFAVSGNFNSYYVIIRSRYHPRQPACPLVPASCWLAISLWVGVQMCSGFVLPPSRIRFVCAFLDDRVLTNSINQTGHEYSFVTEGCGDNVNQGMSAFASVCLLHSTSHTTPDMPAEDDDVGLKGYPCAFYNEWQAMPHISSKSIETNHVCYLKDSPTTPGHWRKKGVTIHPVMFIDHSTEPRLVYAH